AMLGVLRCTQRARCAYKTLSRHCSSSSKTPDEPDQKVKEPDQAKKAAMDKLSALLTDMKIESVSSSDPSSISFKLAKPGRPKKPELREAAEKTKGLEQQMVEAVKEVAASLGGDQEQTRVRTPLQTEAAQGGKGCRRGPGRRQEQGTPRRPLCGHEGGPAERTQERPALHRHDSGQCRRGHSRVRDSGLAGNHRRPRSGRRQGREGVAQEGRPHRG
ncbi:hypothetical protein HPB47_019467, partial [Ixodes persulcatus]